MKIGVAGFLFYPGNGCFRVRINRTGNLFSLKPDQCMDDRQELANIICTVLERSLPEKFLARACDNASIFQSARAAGASRIHAVTRLQRWIWRKQPCPAGSNRFTGLGEDLAMQGLLGSQAGRKGFEARTSEALYLGGASFPTGEDAGLASFPDHVKLVFWGHINDQLSAIYYFNSCAMESICSRAEGSFATGRFNWKSVVNPSSST